jgi:choline dehydrogenase-like flavoprotein
MPQRFDEQVDVVIIGSGPTGATYARTLTDLWPAAKILMVDAGPVVTDPPGMHVANIRDQAAREKAQIASQGPHRGKAYAPVTDEERRTRKAGGLDTPMLRRPGLFIVGGGAIDGEEFPAGHAAHNVGGMGSHWFGACPRPDESERITFIERPVMDEALSKAEKLLHVSNAQFRDSHIAQPLRDALGAVYNAGRTPDRFVQPMPMASRVFPEGVVRSGPDVILGDLLKGASKNFELRPDTVCRKLIMDGNKAIGVELWGVETKKTTNVRADTVVVAADSLHTPQLLFASGIRPKALGHYLNEHPQLTVLAEFVGVPPGNTPEEFKGGGGVLGDRTVVSRMTSGVMWIPYNGEKFPFHVQMSQVEPQSLLPEDAEIGKAHAIVSVSFFLPSDPRWENKVEFSETEKDWLGRPKMKLRFTWSEGDKRRMARARESLEKICQTLGRMLPGHKPRTPPDGSSLHYQGTIRMGAKDDGTSVCDRHSKVWGTDNVYVAGNGVIPTMTAGNPTLTSCALAILGARDIARHHASTKAQPQKATA